MELEEVTKDLHVDFNSTKISDINFIVTTANIPPSFISDLWLYHRHTDEEMKRYPPCTAPCPAVTEGEITFYKMHLYPCFKEFVQKENAILLCFTFEDGDTLVVKRTRDEKMPFLLIDSHTRNTKVQVSRHVETVKQILRTDEKVNSVPDFNYVQISQHEI